jgi:hypothetical protein
VLMSARFSWLTMRLRASVISFRRERYACAQAFPVRNSNAEIVVRTPRPSYCRLA